MKVRDLQFTEHHPCDTNKLHAVYVNGDERITVLDRETGWGGGIRDTETGFTDASGKFWLVSGMFDIRDFPEMTIPEAIRHIKDNANTCMGE